MQRLSVKEIAILDLSAPELCRVFIGSRIIDKMLGFKNGLSDRTVDAYAVIPRRRIGATPSGSRYARSEHGQGHGTAGR